MLVPVLPVLLKLRASWSPSSLDARTTRNARNAQASSWPVPGPRPSGYTKVLRHPGDTFCATHFQNETRPLGLNQTPPDSCVFYTLPTTNFVYLRAHMFHRPQDKQQGFAKEQKVADAQLQSLRQLGLIGPETKGFASAWGGIEPIASAASRPPSRPGPKKSATKSRTYTTIPPVGIPNEPTFPEKGESVSSLISTCQFPLVNSHRRYCDAVNLSHPVDQYRGFRTCQRCRTPRRARASAEVESIRQFCETNQPLTHRPFHRCWNLTAPIIATILHLRGIEPIPRGRPPSEHRGFWHHERRQESHPEGAHLRGE